MIPDLKWKLATLVAPLLLAVQIGWQLDVMRESAYVYREVGPVVKFFPALDLFIDAASKRVYAQVPAYLLGCVLVWCCFFAVLARPRLIRSLSLAHVLVCSGLMCLILESIRLTADTIVRGALGGSIPKLMRDEAFTTFERTEIAFLVVAGCIVVMRLVQCLRPPAK